MLPRFFSSLVSFITEGTTIFCKYGVFSYNWFIKLFEISDSYLFSNSFLSPTSYNFRSFKDNFDRLACIDFERTVWFNVGRLGVWLIWFASFVTPEAVRSYYFSSIRYCNPFSVTHILLGDVFINNKIIIITNIF